MAVTIKRGDECPLAVRVELNGQAVDVSEVETAEFCLGKRLRKLYPGEVEHDAETGEFLLPLTQEETFALPAPAGGGAPSQKLAWCVEVMSAAQLSEELAELKPDYLYLPLTEIPNAAGLLERFAAQGTSIAAVLPRVIQDAELTGLAGLLRRARALGVTQALVGNLGHVALARMAGMEARGDYGLNIANSYAAAAAAGAGLLSVTASFELSLEQIGQLTRAVEVEIIGYGRLPVMLTERCIIKASARRCVCENNMKLSDANGRVMPVLREYVCRDEV